MIRQRDENKPLFNEIYIAITARWSGSNYFELFGVIAGIRRGSDLLMRARTFVSLLL